MKFTNYLLSLLFIGTASTTFAANTSPFTSLQGSIESSSSNNDNDNNDNDNNKHQVHHRELLSFPVGPIVSEVGLLSFTVGPTVSEGCSIDPPDNGESCDKFNQQCLYQILESNDGRIYADFSFWSCGCVEDEVYVCGIRCLDSTCVTVPEPTAAPAGKFKDEPLTAPPIHSWCPQTYPGHDNECEYPGMTCDYLVNSAVENCVCEYLQTSPGVWSRIWKCYDVEDTITDLPPKKKLTATNHPTPAPQPSVCKAKGQACQSSSQCCNGLRCDIYVDICEEDIDHGTVTVVTSSSF
uniref:WAP domain-containing protein n=1 Tax=Pseudo-nitzschia australis TaxID=44445 RepID=A0A7S4AM12_9STRA